MPTGPFAAMGQWQVYNHDGTIPSSGPSPKVTIVKATRTYIKYTRKCKRLDPKGERIHHGKIWHYDKKTVRVSLGGFQHIKARSLP